MATMAVGGLWHGAAWHYFIWGIGHGAALVANHEIDTKGVHVRLPRWTNLIVGWLVTQLVVLVLWSVFRAPALSIAATIWEHALAGGLQPHLLGATDIALVVMIAIGVLTVQLLTRPPGTMEFLLVQKVPAIIRPAFALTAGSLAVYFGANAVLAHPFIYFRF
jgi:hypothetical protein